MPYVRCHILLFRSPCSFTRRCIRTLISLAWTEISMVLGPLWSVLSSLPWPRTNRSLLRTIKPPSWATISFDRAEQLPVLQISVCILKLPVLWAVVPAVINWVVGDSWASGFLLPVWTGSLFCGT